MTADPVIRTRGLSKRYATVEALRGVDLEVQAGEVLAVLGPNGAGKTTTIEILEGYRSRTGGEAWVLGEDPERPSRAWRARVGVVLQSASLEARLTPREALALFAGYYPDPRPVEEAIELAGLEGQADTRIHRLSGGQQRRVDVALALVGHPDLVFLDEPTTGFDPAARRRAWETVARLRELGTTIVLTTHYLEEAEALADRIVVLAGGRVVAEGPPATLGGRDRRGSQISFGVPAGVTPPVGLRAVVDATGQVVVEAGQLLPTLEHLAAWAREEGLDLADLEIHRPTLEEVYLRLIGGAHDREGGA